MKCPSVYYHLQIIQVSSTWRIHLNPSDLVFLFERNCLHKHLCNPLEIAVFDGHSADFVVRSDWDGMNYTWLIHSHNYSGCLLDG